MSDQARHAEPTLVLVGGALPPDTVARFPIVSGAAARQQMGFAEALGREFGARFVCLSYLPAGSDATRKPWTEKTDGIEVHIIPRAGGPIGWLKYFAWMTVEAVRLRRVSSCVFCYNALLWTAPWAFLLSRLAGAPLIFMIADLDPFDSGSFRRSTRALIERFLVRLGRRFILFSPATRSVIPSGANWEVFSGIADERALLSPAPEYTDLVRFVFAGNLGSHGGVTLFIDAAAIVAGSGASCEFHIFGRGQLNMPIPTFLKPRLLVHGFVSDDELDTFLASDCVGVNPRPHNESSLHNAPYKLIYYLSRGILAITTRTPGVQRDLLDVCVVADDSPSSLAAAMQTVLAMTPAERDARAREGRRVIRETRSTGAFKETVLRLLGDSVPSGMRASASATAAGGQPRKAR